MNYNEAYELLNLESDASGDEIRSAYTRLFSDYQIGLNNAPTAQLKTFYQNKLKRLEEAYKLLSGNEVDLNYVEYPSDAPVLQQNTPFNAQNDFIPQTSSKLALSKNTELKPEKNSANWLPILGFVAVLCISVAVFFFILYSNKSTELSKIMNEYKQNKEIVSKIPKNGKLKIVNKLEEDVVIAYVSAVYFDKDMALKSFESSNVNPRPSFINLLPANKTLEFEYAVGQNMVWDGSVVHYSIVAILKSKQFPKNYKYYSGMWSASQNEGKIILAPN
jgi:hypothetical protein